MKAYRVKKYVLVHDWAPHPVFMLYVAISCVQGIWFTILIAIYFSQVKNKPWLPWVCTWIWHRRERWVIIQRWIFRKLQLFRGIRKYFRWCPRELGGDFYEKKTETEILAGLPPFKGPGVLCSRDPCGNAWAKKNEKLLIEILSDHFLFLTASTA